jgi:hypothetical protein
MLVPWNLSYPGTSLDFGPEATGLPLSAAPEFGPTDLTVEDASRARADGVVLGSDFRGGTTISFELHAARRDSTEAEAREWAAAFMTAWRGDAIRSSPGAAAELRAPSGRSVFGRPRRASLDENLARYGKYAITADFVTRDDIWYGPEETLKVPLALSQGGGLVSPLRSPLVARGYTSRANGFVVGGALPAWPVITIRGQILNPTVEIAGVAQFGATTSLAFDEWLTIDTQPGVRSVLRNGTRIAALTRASDFLSAAALTPGSHTLTLSGSASTGTPSATVAWRAAYPTP